MRNTFLALSILYFLILSVPSRAQKERVEAPPNIILIITDDQRWDALGYAGNGLIQTPNMDQLAREGVYFSKAIVTTPICSASRASVFTGLYERTHRYTFQTGPIQETFMKNSYPRLLKESGYQTAFYGKFGVNYEAAESLFDLYESYDRNSKFKDYRGYYYKTLGSDTVHLTQVYRANGTGLPGSGQCGTALLFIPEF